VINETAAAPGGANTTSLQRKDAADSDDNSGDFAAAEPTPAAANAGDGGGGTGEPGALRIHDIQGGSWISPHDDEQVTNVPGIVTAVRSTGSSRGFWIQDPTADSSSATSEGIFVFTSSPGVAVGDSVLVSGTVNDFYPLATGETVSTTSNLSITEIGSPTTIVLSHGKRAAGSRGDRAHDGAVRVRARPRRRPDIVAVEEVQDDTGDTDDGTVTANQTLTKLTDAIVAAGGPRYDWREIDPVNDQDGGEPGGNIRVVFLFNPARVSFVARGSSSVNRSATGTSVVKSHGDPALTLSTPTPSTASRRCSTTSSCHPASAPCSTRWCTSTPSTPTRRRTTTRRSCACSPDRSAGG
jgi:predicted extracellular nuclease